MSLSSTHVGLLAGLLTSLLWAITSLLFTGATRRLGATTTNAARISMALALLAVVQWLRTSDLVPELAAAQWWDLALSGVIGLAICDQALFLSFALIGPRRALLVQTTTPLFAMALGWFLLGETVGPLAAVGVALTLAGVVWVVRERSDSSGDDRHLVKGVVLAVLASLLQALGALLAKRGMGHGWLEPAERLDPLTTTYVRMLFGTLGVVPLVWWAWRRREQTPGPAGERRRGWWLVSAATLLGPVLGVWMSLESFDRVPVGLAQTLIGLSPVMVLPLVALGGERITGRAVAGAVVAVAGSSLLFLA